MSTNQTEFYLQGIGSHDFGSSSESAAVVVPAQCRIKRLILSTEAGIDINTVLTIHKNGAAVVPAFTTTLIAADIGADETHDIDFDADTQGVTCEAGDRIHFEMDAAAGASTGYFTWVFRRDRSR